LTPESPQLWLEWRANGKDGALRDTAYLYPRPA
jgi:hypothetical protein